MHGAQPMNFSVQYARKHWWPCSRVEYSRNQICLMSNLSACEQFLVLMKTKYKRFDEVNVWNLKTRPMFTTMGWPCSWPLWKSLSEAQLNFYSEVAKLIKLILVLPASNCESVRAFSAMKILKTYLTVTTGQAILNHLMVLRAYKDRTDSLNLIDIANDFVSKSERRLTIFGKFTSADLCWYLSLMYQVKI